MPHCVTDKYQTNDQTNFIIAQTKKLATFFSFLALTILNVDINKKNSFADFFHLELTFYFSFADKIFSFDIQSIFADGKKYWQQIFISCVYKFESSFYFNSNVFLLSI